MGFSSMDDFISKVSNGGQFKRIDWNKNFLPTTAAVAGEWFCLARGGGNPPADSIYNTGATNSFIPVFGTSSNSGAIQGIPGVTPSTAHIINASAFSASATTAPAVLMLVDLLGYYRVSAVTVTATQSFTNAVSLPRYGDGSGVMAFAWNTNATAMGAAIPTLQIRYTNSNGVSNRLTPSSPALPSCKTAAANGLILYSGTGAGKYGPFLPLQSGDSGILTVDAVQLSVSYVSGEFSIGLCRPLLTLPITTLGVASERDLVNQMPSLPRIYDGACLIWLIYNGANTPTNSAFFGHLDIGWG